MPPAITCYRRARLLDPDDRELVYYLGIARLQSGDDAAALADLRETLRLMPDYQPARLRLAELLMKTGPRQSWRRRCSDPQLRTGRGKLRAFRPRPLRTGPAVP